VSDYAHHPSEIRALLQGAAQAGYRRISAVFQPHRYSRTCRLGAQFPPAFDGLDTLLLAPVYAASEVPQSGGTSADLYARFREHEAGQSESACRCILVESLDAAAEHMRRNLAGADLLLALGAGDVERVAHTLAAQLAAGALGPVLLSAAENRLLDALGDDPQIHLEQGRVLGRLTTYGVGGAAALWCEPEDVQALQRLLGAAHGAGVPVRVMGGGSNLLIGELPLPGLTLRLGRGFREMALVDGCLQVGAAVPVARLLEWLEAADMGGLAFLEGIPGSVGGLLKMNAGAWGDTIGSHVERVHCLRPDGTCCRLGPDELGFGYRSCPGLAGLIAVSAEIRVTPAHAADMAAQRREYAERRAWLRGLRTAGSVFKNPVGDYAGRLVEAAGGKEVRVGGASVSERHGNIMVAGEGARPSDIVALIDIIKARVREYSGIELEEEITRWL